MESDKSAPTLDLGEVEVVSLPAELTDAWDTCEDCMDETWSTQLAEDADSSVVAPSLDEITETEPLSDRMSVSCPREWSTLDDSEGTDGG